MSDPFLSMQRQIQALQDQLERLRKTDTGQSAGGFTPAFTGTGTAGTFTYTKQFGIYTRIYSQVFIYGAIQISAITVVPTGNMTITGLPFTALGVDAYHAAGVEWAFISNFNYTAAALDLTGYIRNATSVIELYESFDNAAAVQVPAANFTNANCFLTFSAVYTV